MMCLKTWKEVNPVLCVFIVSNRNMGEFSEVVGTCIFVFIVMMKV